MTQLATWQQQLKHAITDPAELYARLELDPATLPNAHTASAEFSLRVPLPFIARMEKGNYHDPLLQQVLPQGIEQTPTPGYSHDPLQEQRFTPIPGLLHKYHGRVLLLTSGGCAVNCRYCFRRHFPYAQHQLDERHWQQALDYIRADSSIFEVILSGGDPLLARDAVLERLSAQLALIPHLTLLRIHTRLPIVIPERITPELLTWFTHTRLKPVLVLHSNHANEIDADVADAVTRLRRADVLVLNQSVLLKGVNDQVDALVALSHALGRIGVVPYYLHLLDPVQGAAHFAVNARIAKRLHTELRGRLPGYLLPRLVTETPGAYAKTVL